MSFETMRNSHGMWPNCEQLHVLLTLGFKEEQPTAKSTIKCYPLKVIKQHPTAI